MGRFLQSIGVGSAEVDTVLPTDTISPGQSIDARVDVEGGSSEQEIDEIYFALVTQYRTEDEGYQSAAIDEFEIAEPFTIGDGEEQSMPVTIDVPYRTPLTMGHTDVWIRTGLDIDWAVDPKDKDHIEVRPDARIQALFDAMESMGFSFKDAECKRAVYSTFGDRTFVQELEFRPFSGEFADDVDEVELLPMPSEDEVTVVVEVDRRGGFFEEVGDFDESKDSYSYTGADAAAIEADLRELIRRHR